MKSHHFSSLWISRFFLVSFSFIISYFSFRCCCKETRNFSFRLVLDFHFVEDEMLLTLLDSVQLQYGTVISIHSSAKLVFYNTETNNVHFLMPLCYAIVEFYATYSLFAYPNFSLLVPFHLLSLTFTSLLLARRKNI